MSGAPALLLLRRYQVAGNWPNWPTGSNMPTVVTPAPFQSPTTGTQSGAPYWNSGMSGGPALLLLRRYQVPAGWPKRSKGSKTPTVSMPSPFQSPTTGMSPGHPYWNFMSGAPGLLLLRRYQVNVDGSTTPIVLTPSPFQSPTTGIQPGPP